MYLTQEEFEIVYPTVKETNRADGFPGHFCCAYKCHFRLHHHTLNQFGKRYRISTVGLHEDLLDKDKYETFNLSKDLLFETMVCKEDDITGQVISFEVEKKFSRTSIEATKIHYNLVQKYTGELKDE